MTDADRRPVGAAEVRRLVTPLAANPLFRKPLTALLDWIDYAEREIDRLRGEQAAFEARLQYQRSRIDTLAQIAENDAMAAELVKLSRLVDHAEELGQLVPPITDRPGGPQPGDVPCECELAGPINPACPHHGQKIGSTPK